MQVEVFGNTQWETLYAKLDLGIGGVITGPTEEAKALQRWFEDQKHRKPTLLRPPPGGANVSRH